MPARPASLNQAWIIMLSPGLKKLLEEILGTQYFAVLNTLGCGKPYANLVSFAASPGLKSLVFVTPRDTAKYANLKANSSVSLLIDNRSNQPGDIARASAVTALGAAREVLENKNELCELLVVKNPMLRAFVYNPAAALILVDVDEYLVAGFEKTQRVSMAGP